MQTIPDDFYDAAKVDGAGPFARFKDVTIPLLSRTLLLVTVLTMISLSAAVHPRQHHARRWTRRADPHHRDARPLRLHQGLSNMQLGYASAISVVLMAIILVITLIQFRVPRTRWEY